MSANNKRNQTSQQQSQQNKTTEHSSEFESKSNSQQRECRHFLLSNKRTELTILQGDILKLKVDAIVNVANEHMLKGDGLDGAIHDAAGPNLLKACQAHKQIYPDVRLPTGHSRILLSYELSSKTYYIINTAGPKYRNACADRCKKELASCYKTSLALANIYDLGTIAFTAISCGIYGYPLDEGAEIALKTVDNELGGMTEIFFVLNDDKIYDAWITKAEELNFISIDKPAQIGASTPTQSNTNKQKTNEKTYAPAVIDLDTLDKTGTAEISREKLKSASAAANKTENIFSDEDKRANNKSRYKIITVE